MNNYLLTVSIKPTQLICITEDNKGVQSIRIAGRRFLVQANRATDKGPTKFIATTKLNDELEALKLTMELQKAKQEYYLAKY
jgi:hypothetical protein